MKNKILLILTIMPTLTLSAVPTETDILNSTETHFPIIKQAILQIESAHKDLQAAQGSWDAKVVSNSYFVPRGYFTRRYWDGQIEKPLRIANSKIYAGYSYGHSGIWPDQFSTQTTNSNGSPRIGANFSLLRGMIIDEKRTNFSIAQSNLSQTKAQSFYSQILAKRDAIISYWTWISMIRNYHVSSDLLKMAEDRKEVLEKRVKAGDISEVIAKENLQYVARRKADLASARLLLKQAALDLSLYLRDQDGTPIFLKELPDDSVDSLILSKTEQIEKEISPNISNNDLLKRSDLFAAGQEVIKSDLAVKLSENSFFPKLDLGIDYTRNLGNEDPTNAPHVWTVFINIEIPLEFNLIKGQAESSYAQKRIADSKFKFLQEYAKVEIEKIDEAIKLSKERMNHANDEMNYAQELLNAEYYKFSRGGSNFFLINIREEALANAKQNYINSQLELINAHASYKVASNQFPEL